ncbi:RagB/SusD family nutrient uptake outer membrane protein [Bacteroides sp. 1001136B_160425_E2]|uniref:RagB/SusD family nutrient uptake outer membrane protein n=1 Tax=Bacteroides sp. 1001136B_160425_E2 TaxID=2787083 RepID=UPI001E3EB542|nr:RagB/SusD family nutrient uptake outer membrane protein [Bacteroides sp. 1001136B_160425_E2]
MKKNMKNLKNIFTMALVTTCMSACTGFLDIEPETTLTGKNFYKSPDDIRSALYSTYSSLRDNGLYSASIYLFGDVRSDVAFPNQTNYYANTFRHEIEKFTISANNSGNQNYWAHHYKGIIRANTVIEKGKELFGNDEAVQKYIAEAEVLRALFYFNLVRAYGGVPIIMDIPQEYTDSRGHLRASTEEVYIRILTDLTTAIESNNLYRSTNSGEKTPTGRVNKYAAEALLGKVLLSMPNDITEAAYPNVEAWKDISANPNITVFYPETTTTQYEAAKYYLEDVINNGGYELYPNFSELFKPTNKHSSESIWEVEYKTGQAEGLGSPFYTLFSPASYAPRNKANSNGYIPSPISNQGNGACAPTGYFMDMAKKWDSMYPDYQYEVRKFDDVIYTDTRISNGNIKLDTDGVSYLPVNENKDYTQNVAYPYDPYTGTSFRTSVKGFSADDQWMCGKYMGSSEYKVNDSDDNWYILRFADVLLLLAEAEAHISDGVLSQSVLNNTINLVRERAGIVPYLASGDSNKEWVLDTPEKVYQAIYDERTLELAFEGHRWFDLVRSGKAVEVMNQHFTNFYNAYTSNSSPNVNNYYMKSEKFEIDQYCTLFPIPSQEIRSNPKLTQNYGAR